jgi:predicted nuclease of predicted toxin-antitoxin system
LRILLDENLDWRLERDLPGHEVASVPLIGWAGLQNGLLLQRAQTHFDILITMDSNMLREQDLRNFEIAVVVLKAPSNRLADTGRLMKKIIELLPNIKRGAVTTIR